jgi:hypothetical protein
MPEKSSYETVARKYAAHTGLDPADDFLKDAAANKPPGKGGSSEKLDTDKKRTQHGEESSLEREHVIPSPRDTREAPVPNPNGNSTQKAAT